MPINKATMIDEKALIDRNISLIALFAPIAAMVYPFLLMLFHAQVGAQGSDLTASNIVGAAIALLCAFFVPVIGFVVACHSNVSPNVRRLAYATVAAPPLYVFLGVVQALIGSSIPDPWVWCAVWLCAALFTCRMSATRLPAESAPTVGVWRVIHGVSGVVVCIFVFFHLANHMMGLFGPDEHAAFMERGRLIYRASFVEPVLVIFLLFQVISGFYLAWRWSSSRFDFFRTFQIASGVYLSVFILGHMNSVFIYARTYLGIPTDWDFATGAPTGLIHDPWNIRLFPHYVLGVFFVLSHLVAGLRVVLAAHGVRQGRADFVWYSGITVSAAIAVAIIAGMSGVRI